MALRKSVEETSRSILMARTTLFMATSQVFLRTIRRLEQMTQDRAFQRGEISRPAFARPRNIDIDVVRDAAVLDHQHAIGQCNGFRNVVRHQDRGEGLIMPDSLQ